MPEQQRFSTPKSMAFADVSPDGIIRDVAICRAGEAKGHGVYLDEDFIAAVVAMGNAADGLKCRFGHPSICFETLGTYLGKFRNFRQVDGGKAIADLHMDPVAKNTPNGDLYTYVLNLCQSAPDTFGCSIQFASGELYHIDADGNKVAGSADDETQPTFIGIEDLLACDVVESPAATDSFFSNKKYSVAVQMAQFFEAYPEAQKFLQSQPALMRFFEQQIPGARNFFKSLSNTQTSMKQLSEKAKAALRKLGKLKFDINATTTDGVEIVVITSGDQPAIGDAVEVVGTDGSRTPAADGTHVINGGDLDGQIIETTNGVISSISTPDPNPADPPSETTITDPMLAEKELSSVKKELGEVRKELGEVRKELGELKAKFGAMPADFHTQGGGEDPEKKDKKEVSPWNKEGERAYEQGKRRRSGE
jgi:hypothetical protein